MRAASPAPGWNTADGKGAYYGNHTPPEAVAFGPGERGAVACAMGEAGAHLIGVDLQGRRQLGLANRASFGGGKISLATDGKLLWVANVDGRSGEFTIWRCDLATGAYAPWKRKDAAGKDVLDLPVREKSGPDQCRAFGILLSDSAGQVCTSRNYWSNKAASNTNDVPDEAKLEPSLWSELRCE